MATIGVIKGALGTPVWTVEYATYDNKSADFSSEVISPTGFAMGDSGSKFYVAEAADTIYQYDLTTAWDISTASYASKNYDTSSETSSVQGVFFKSDGTSMYVLDDGGNTIYQYTLSTAWDVSTASYASKALVISGQSTSTSNIFIRADGLKLYVIDTGNDSVDQYTLAVAWDVSSGTYDSKTYDYSSETSNAQGLFFRDNGKRMFISGLDNKDVYQYDLSTAWDVTTATYNNMFFDTNSEDTSSPFGISFRDDGTLLFVQGSTNDKIYQYSLR